MIGFSVETPNLRQIESRFARLDSELDSLRPLWEKFGTEFYAEESKLFSAAPWKPLSPAYAEQKRKRFGAKPLLRATDVLFHSLTKQGAEGNIHRVDNDRAEFGSSDFKAILHRLGTTRMPARDPLAEPDLDRYQTIAGEYAVEIVKKAGFN